MGNNRRATRFPVRLIARAGYRGKATRCERGGISSGWFHRWLSTGGKSGSSQPAVKQGRSVGRSVGVCRFAALSYASATGLSMNAPTRSRSTASLPFPPSSLSLFYTPSLILSLSHFLSTRLLSASPRPAAAVVTMAARSFNSCTPPENRFHECKSRGAPLRRK